MGTSRYTDYKSVNWDIPIWSPDWKQVDNLLTNKEQGYQLAQAALDAPIDSSNLGTDPLVREQLRLNREQAQADLAKTYAQPNGLHAGNQALQSYLQQIGREKNPGGVEYQLMQNKADIVKFQEEINKKEGWSPEQKQQWLSMNLADYKGAVYEGELKGFSGQDLSKFINDSLYAQKYLEKMKFHEQEGFLIDPQGKKITLDGSTAIYADSKGNLFRDKLKTQTLTSEEMILAVYPAMQQDPEYQAYMKDKTAIKLYGTTGTTKHNWKDLITVQSGMIDLAVQKLDSAKSLEEKKAILTEYDGKDYSKIDEETVNAKLETKKAELQSQKLESSRIRSYDDLLSVEGNNDLLRTVKANSKLYEVDNFSITSEHFLDEFGKLRMNFEMDMAKKKAEEQLTLPDYWISHIKKINDDIVAGADEFDTYEKLTTGINKLYKELPSNVATLNYEFKTKVSNNPNSPLYKALMASGFDPAKEDFVKMVYDEKTGNVTVNTANLDKMGALKSVEGISNTVQTYIDNVKKQANSITMGQTQLSLLIKKYQEYSGDKNIADNLKDVSEASFLGSNGKAVNQAVTYKQFQEVGTAPNTKTYNDYLKEAKILSAKENKFFLSDNERNNYYIKQIKERESKEQNDKFVNDYYDKYVEFRKGKGKDFKSKEDVLKYGFVDYDGLSQNREFYKEIIEKDKTTQSKSNVLNQIDLTASQKKKNFEEAMAELKKTQSSFETLYSISDINNTSFDPKVSKLINAKKKALNTAIGSTVISKGNEAGLLSDVDTGALITDTELKDRIITALNSQKSYDEEGKLLPQKDNIDYHVGMKNGKLYGVMNVNFADEYKDKHSYSVQFEINDETPDIKKFLIDDERLFQQNELIRTQEIAKQLKGNQVAITNYSLPDGQKFNINLSRKIKTAGDSDNSEYQARIVLPKTMTDRLGQSSTFIEFNTNDIATPPRIVGILEKISTNADYFKTLKETNFANDDEGFMKFITQDIEGMTNGKIGAYQSTQLYDWLIKPMLDKGKILQQQPPSQSYIGNFPNPQGFKW
jgi:hypothetical protein